MAGDIMISGLTGAFDSGAFVQQILQLRSIPIQRLQQEKALVQAKLSSLSNFVGAVKDFRDLFENLDVDGLFERKSVEVSDESVLTASVTKDAPLISFTVNVNKLASAEIRVSNGGISNSTTAFSSSGTMTITYNTGSSTETFNIDYNAGETIGDLITRINSSQDKVKASVYYDGSLYRLMLSESDVSASEVETDTTGGIYAISVSGQPSELGTDFDTLQLASNAEITIGSGSPITSSSNEFVNVMSGVIVTAKDVGSADITIREDYGGVRRFFSKFEKEFNAVVELIDGLTGGESPLFAGEGTIRLTQTGIVDRLDPLINRGLIDYDGETGKISINDDKLNELLESDPESVKNLMKELKDSYASFLNGQVDVFGTFEESFTLQIERIDQRISQLAQRLQEEERLLRLEFSRLEAFIARANELRERFRMFMVTLSEMNNQGGS